MKSQTVLKKNQSCRAYFMCDWPLTVFSIKCASPQLSSVGSASLQLSSVRNWNYRYRYRYRYQLCFREITVAFNNCLFRQCCPRWRVRVPNGSLYRRSVPLTVLGLREWKCPTVLAPHEGLALHRTPRLMALTLPKMLIRINPHEQFSSYSSLTRISFVQFAGQ